MVRRCTIKQKEVRLTRGGDVALPLFFCTNNCCKANDAGRSNGAASNISPPVYGGGTGGESIALADWLKSKHEQAQELVHEEAERSATLFP